MRYLVKARVKPGRESALARAIDEKTLGHGSVAGDEYLWDMEHARLDNDGTVSWIEVCSCSTPLAEERPYWEEYFELFSVKDAHAHKNCRDLNGRGESLPVFGVRSALAAICHLSFLLPAYRWPPCPPPP